ncbi:butyrophilin-like protein 1 [Talpa occidentalis]|uniref:butyrophilin-like protein 1 n=1 Tax=Talpa occidentalis TaxID=50954 RepID=UPI0023F9687D|nr:butyrophilin-like protein 1 [Talpa occidentalis]
MSVFTERFRVLGTPDPIVAELGKDATLPCSLDPVMSAENMELRWFRSYFWESVFTYEDQQKRDEELMAQYTGWTSLVGTFLSKGVAAVRIHRVRASDNGLYTCFFSNGVFHGQASLQLQVAGMGSVPQVHISGPEEDRVCVVCTVSGWFPEPHVQWRHPRGEQFLEFSKVYTQDTEWLFSVEAALVVRDSSAGSVTCSILNPVLGQEKAMANVIPESFFPGASPWKPAFLVSLPLLLLLLLGAACCTQKEYSTLMQELQEQRNLYQAKEEDLQTKEGSLKDTGVGSAPQVHIKGPEEDGVQWRHPRGEQFLEFSKVQAQDTEGLFSVESALVVRDSSVANVTCSILNPIVGQEKATAIVIPEPFFPRASPWKLAFLVSLSFLLLLLMGAACYTWREYSTQMQELQEHRRLCRAKEEDRQTKEDALKDTDQRKAAYLAGE